MKKSFLVIFIVFITLGCTACINRFAVQELNNNAKELLAKGQTEAAIARLESSIDLDESIFETHYNLAVAYMQAKLYDKALKALEKVQELKPDFADTYHSIAVINEELAYDILSGENDKDKKLSNTEQNDENSDKTKDLSDEDKTKICEYFTIAIDNYNKYLTKKENADDKDKIEQKINDLNNNLRKYGDNTDKAE
ncbi:tetratricopeptide repeat protein [bacterium]|nr:tetratricopeptide repeat protein [bacterium]